MKSTLDLIDILYSHIYASTLRTAINGGIYKMKRPAGSDKEDIVINSLPTTTDQLQQAVLNVNIHVPNIPVAANGVQDQKMPNTARLKALAAIALVVFKEAWFDEGNFSVNQQNTFDDETANDHYLNFRIQFYSLNI